jgi:acyl-CoA dehydrogenase
VTFAEYDLKSRNKAKIASDAEARRGNKTAARRKVSLSVIPPSRSLKERAQTAAIVAAAHAGAVDRDARFPQESFDALKRERLLGILIPTELGGEGASPTDLVEVCFTLGRACGSTAMIYAMHQIVVAALVRHAAPGSWHDELIRRIADEQLLMASSTTDGQGGGDLRKSECAVVDADTMKTLIKSATVMSYGAQADGVLTTARRTPDAPPTDQAAVALLKDDYRLTPLMSWDTLGMRGTCSSGFTLEARFPRQRILEPSYREINSRTVMPVAHLTWSAVWAGIAAGAVDRARAFVRAAARKSAGAMPPGAAHLTRASSSLLVLRGTITAALQAFEAVRDNAEALEAIDLQARLNLHKVTASELAVSIVMSALQACGLAGYRNDGEFTIGRNLRDVLSSTVMINNDRILANVGQAALLSDFTRTLTN